MGVGEIIAVTAVSILGYLVGWMICRGIIGPDPHHYNGWWGRNVSGFTYAIVSFFWPLWILWAIGRFFYELPNRIKYTYWELKEIYRKRNK